MIKCYCKKGKVNQMKRKNYYCDMDGVLADFNGEPNALDRFQTEKGFFKNLKPIKNNVKALRDLIADGNNVYILSISPNEQADNDKVEWLKKWIPEMPDGNMIILRTGQKKQMYVRTPYDNVLFDDYGKNCREFAADGYEAYKIDKWHSIARWLRTI